MCGAAFRTICADVFQIASDPYGLLLKRLLDAPELFGAQKLVPAFMQADFEPTHACKAGKPRLR
jgi:hypothetical protein